MTLTFPCIISLMVMLTKDESTLLRGSVAMFVGDEGFLINLNNNLINIFNKLYKKRVEKDD